MNLIAYIKKCIKCDKHKVLSDFKMRLGTGKYRNSCKECDKLYFSTRYAENIDNIKEQRRLKNAENPEKNRQRVKDWKVNNPEKVKANRERQKERNKTPERRAILAKKASKWRSNNPDKMKKIKKKQRNRIEVRIADNLRKRLKIAIKNGQKKGSAIKDLGCSIEELKFYLKKQFYSNKETGEMMTWDNYGFYGWHIDHIKPLSNFDLTNEEQIKIASHYNNLQPLWAKDNLTKSDKIIK